MATWSVLSLLLLASVLCLGGSDGSRCSSLRQDGRSLRTTLNARMFDCTAPFFDAVAHGNSSLEFRLAVNEFCNDVDHRACVAGVARSAKLCLMGTDLVEFRVNQDNLRMALGEMCLRRGVRVATLFGGVVHHADTGVRYPLWQVCYLKLEHVISVDNHVGDSIAKYKFLKQFKTCVANLGADQTYVVNASVDLLNKIIAKFKCVHPLSKKKPIYCYVLTRDFFITF